MVRLSGKIRRLLVDGGLVSAEDWESAVKTGKSPIDVLVDSGEVSETALFGTLGKAAGLAPVDISRLTPDPQAIEALPEEVCVQQCILPVAKNGDVLTIAVSDPFDVLLLDDLNILSGCRVKPLLSYPSAIRGALESLFDNGRARVDELLDEVTSGDIEVKESAEDTDDLELAVDDSEGVPAVKLVNLILLRALREGASDIHIEPGETAIRVRLRIDGRLVEALTAPKGLLPALISRLKILSSLDIAERMGPQDGKFQIRFEGRTIDFRLSTLPVVGGEKAVMRILDTGSVALRLDTLGYEPRCLSDMQTAIASAYGMVLVTGPTGSGKSTTLYAAVQEVATPEINVVTVEDPVEYNMDGINQVPVNPKRGLSFAGALRSILRQDPDVVLVGEIRDAETAEIATKAALTGHLVLSTLHTNDAPGAITRLIDMGIDPFMVSSSLVCVAAQRLVRKLCTHCREATEVPEEELRAVGYTDDEISAGVEVFEPHKPGCPRCKQGYKGRFALLETLSLNSSLKRMVVEGRSVQEIKAEGIRSGMLTLRRVGLLNVIRGKTSLSEVLRVTVDD